MEMLDGAICKNNSQLKTIKHFHEKNPISDVWQDSKIFISFFFITLFTRVASSQSTHQVL